MKDEVGMVMKCALRSRYQDVLPGTAWEYFIIIDPYRRVRSFNELESVAARHEGSYGAYQVTKKEAYEYIKEHGLVSAYKTPDGEIWDTFFHDGWSKHQMKSKAQSDAIDRYWDY